MSGAPLTASVALEIHCEGRGGVGYWPELFRYFGSVGLTPALTGQIDWPYWDWQRFARRPVHRIVILPLPLFLYPRVISQASREHHFTPGDLSRPDRRCGLRDFAQTLAVAVDHGNHNSPRP